MSLFISFKYSKKKSLKKGITNQLLFWTDSPDFKLSICFHYYFLFACFLTKNIAQILPGVTKKNHQITFFLFTVYHFPIIRSLFTTGNV